MLHRSLSRTLPGVVTALGGMLATAPALAQLSVTESVTGFSTGDVTRSKGTASFSLSPDNTAFTLTEGAPLTLALQSDTLLYATSPIDNSKTSNVADTASRSLTLNGVTHTISQTFVLNFSGPGAIASIDAMQTPVTYDLGNGNMVDVTLGDSTLDGQGQVSVNLSGKIDATFTLRQSAVPSPDALVTALLGVVPGATWLLRRRKKATK